MLASIENARETKSDIYLLGSGVFSFFDITLITQDILSQCKTVFYLHDLPSLERYLKKICRQVVNLLPLYYTEGRDRNDIYSDVSHHVIETAQKEKPIALIMHGHPLVYSTISRLILEGAPRKGLTVEVFPAVSSLDRMFVDLKLDIGEHGIQVHLASAAIGKNIALNTQAGCILFQIGHIFSNLSQRKVKTLPEEIFPLQKYLLQFYPERHEVKVIECAVELGVQSRLTPLSIAEMHQRAEVFNYNASLYIPPFHS